LRVNSIVEFKAESDSQHEMATGHLVVGDYHETWNMGDTHQSIWFWWDTMNGEAELTLKVNGETLFEGTCAGTHNGEVRVINTCQNPKVYKTIGSPRLSERGKTDITHIDY
jgi:hypothetical protein